MPEPISRKVISTNSRRVNRPSAPASSHMSGLQNLNTQISKIHAGMACRFWHQTVAGHTGQGIDFQEIQFTVCIFQKVHARTAVRTNRLRATHGQFAHQVFLRLAQIFRRALINRIIAVIFGFVVVKLGSRNNMNTRGPSLKFPFVRR